MNRQATAERVRDHEGVRHVVYQDTEGIKTIGVGFNLEREGAAKQINACGADYQSLCVGRSALSTDQVEVLFQADLDRAILDAPGCVRNFHDHPDDVQGVIVDMVFNLGVAGFKAFRKAIACLEGGDYCGAADEMQKSLWAKQVPNRAAENIALVRGFCK